MFQMRNHKDLHAAQYLLLLDFRISVRPEPHLKSTYSRQLVLLSRYSMKGKSVELRLVSSKASRLG